MYLKGKTYRMILLYPLPPISPDSPFKGAENSSTFLSTCAMSVPTGEFSGTTAE